MSEWTKEHEQKSESVETDDLPF